MRSVFGSMLLIACVVACGGGLAFVKYQSVVAQMSSPPPPEFPESVVFSNALETNVRQSTTSIGTVLAPQSLHLRTELVGIVESINMTSGSIVNPGDILLQFDTSVERAELLSAEASKKIANSTFRRTQQAAKVSAVTQSELEQAEASLSQADAEILRLQAIIRKKTLRAPFRARVGLFDVHVGQYLAEGSEIAMLQGIDSFVHVDFSMPQHVADEVMIGDPIKLLLSPQPIIAAVVAIDSQADRVTRGVNARARVDNPPRSMQPNDSVKVEMEYGPTMTGVLVPASAIRRSPTGSFVFVVVPDDKGALRAHEQEVLPGKTVGQEVVILGGIAPGQQVVSDGSFKVHERSLLVSASGAAR